MDEIRIKAFEYADSIRNINSDVVNAFQAGFNKALEAENIGDAISKVQNRLETFIKNELPPYEHCSENGRHFIMKINRDINSLEDLKKFLKESNV